MNMMDLKGYSPENLERLKESCLMRQNYAAIRYIEEFRETYGYEVRVVRGRKVEHGTVGRCFWMGTRNYSKTPDYWGIKTVTRIGIRDEAGQVYWTSLDNVEVIAGTYEDPSPKKKPNKERFYRVNQRLLKGMEESVELREAREKTEYACEIANELHEEAEELFAYLDKLTEGTSEYEEAERKWKEADEREEAAKKRMQKLDQEYKKLYFRLLGSAQGR